MKDAKLPTIKEIAKQLNVSVSTVSRALHDHPGIGLRTRMRVQQLAQQLNYEPNQTAIFFKQRRTFTLSRESVALLKELSAERNSRGQESVSAILDELLTSVREERRRRAIERSIEKYYSERSPEEEEEEVAWGKFALANFPVEELSDGDSK